MRPDSGTKLLSLRDQLVSRHCFQIFVHSASPNTTIVTLLADAPRLNVRRRADRSRCAHMIVQLANQLIDLLARGEAVDNDCIGNR